MCTNKAQLKAADTGVPFSFEDQDWKWEEQTRRGKRAQETEQDAK